MDMTDKTIEDLLDFCPKGEKKHINGTIEYKLNNRYFDYCTKIPSTSTDGYWVACFNSKGGEFKPEAGVKHEIGKWLIFADKTKIDSIWAKVIRLMYEGKLGHYSKCSTAKPNTLQSKKDSHVICIYCNEGEALVIRQNLRDAGFEEKLPYKLDKTAREGKYAVNGDKNISTYFM